MTRILAALSIVAIMAISANAGPITGTYVDAESGSSGNTVNNSTDSATDWVGGSSSNTDNKWYHVTGYTNYGQESDHWQSMGADNEDSPLLKTTITGLTTGDEYKIYVIYLAKDAWTVQAGLSAGSLTAYNVSNGTDHGACYGTTHSYEALLGTATVDDDGKIAVYVDDVTGASSDRAKYDGVSYAPVPEPSTLALLIFGGFGLLLVRRWRK